VPNLTDLSVRSLPAGLHFDGRLKSFGIRVGKNRRTWIVVKGTNRTKVALGHYPALSLAEARKRALVALGSPHDPRVVPTFPEALAAFLDLNRWKPNSKKVLVSSLRHFTWTRPLNKITHEDVAQAIEAIRAPSARAHALQDIRTFFNWCIPRYLSSSPAQGIKKPPQPSRTRVLSDDELKRVWLAAQEIGHPFGTIVRLLILTGQRKSEIGTLTWEQITDDRITLKETNNGREHTFPIGVFVSSLLSNVPAGARSGYLFARLGAADMPYNGYGYGLRLLHKLSGTSDWTLHDLRRTFATGLASLGIPIHVTERLLNHVSGSQSGIVGDRPAPQGAA
jgi:integrase